MNKSKFLLLWVTEIYFILSVIYYWINTPNLLNPIAIGLILALSCLIYLRNKILGIIISIVFILANFYMVLALLTELSEFDTFDANAQELIIGGSIYFGLNFLMAVLMIRKYIKIAPAHDE